MLGKPISNKEAIRIAHQIMKDAEKARKEFAEQEAKQYANINYEEKPIETVVKSSSSGVGILSLLGLLFIGLKLGGVIDWSWWWILFPFWGQVALAIGVLICLAICVGIAKILTSRWDKKN